MKGDTNKNYACKVIAREKLTTRLLNNLQNEIKILAKIKSPNVIALMDLQKTKNNFYLIMEYCNAGDLLNFKTTKGKFKEKEARIILKQVVDGFKEIYKKGVMHRDLKLANILVHLPNEDLTFKDIRELDQKKIEVNKRLKEVNLSEKNMQVKIADLGFARELDF